MSLYELFLFAALVVGCAVFLRKTLRGIDKKSPSRKVAL
jgi:hypothetical protein